MAAVPASSQDRQASDEDLAVAAQGGDQDALETLFLRHQRSLRAQVARSIGDCDAVHDIVQECFLDLLRGLATYQSDRPFLPWMRALCRHRVARECRRWSRDRTRVYADLDQILIDDGRPTNADHQLHLLAALARCLPRLRSDQRAWLEAHYVGQEPLAAIGNRLGRSANAMAKALARVRDALRRCTNTVLAGREP